MAVMCPYGGKCQRPGGSCPHYRWEDDEQQMSCFLEADRASGAKKEEKGGTKPCRS